MKTIEEILEAADFSKETSQKNRLFYELFQKPVPVQEGKLYGLSEEELGFVSGGVSRSADVQQKTELSEDQLKEALLPGETGSSPND